jgi:hypothetical protein
MSTIEEEIMTTQDILRQQLSGYHDILEQTVGDCGQEALDKNLLNATITNIGSIYVHVVVAEDEILHGMLQGKPGVYQAQGWAGRTGVEAPPMGQFPTEWGRKVRLNLPVFREYAKVVYAATDAYIARLTDSDLARQVQTEFIGEQSVAFVISNILGWHIAEHTGEIAALKGVQGLKGLPF